MPSLEPPLTSTDPPILTTPYEYHRPPDFANPVTRNRGVFRTPSLTISVEPKKTVEEIAKEAKVPYHNGKVGTSWPR